MATAQQFRHEDVAAVPRGWKVRTVSHPSGHQVRVAFPPGTRKRGSGKLVSILHPRRENRCRQRNTLLEAIAGGAAAGTAVILAQEGIQKIRKPQNNRGETQKFYQTQQSAVQAAKRLAKKSGNAVYIYTPEGGRRVFVLTEYFETARHFKAAGSEVITVGPPQGNRKNPYPRTDQFRLAERKIDAVLAKRTDLTPGERSRVRSAALGVYQTTMQHGIYHAGAVHEALKSARYYRPNPNGNGASQAAQLYEDFHGRAPSDVLLLQEQLLRAGDYTALGDMGSLWLEPVSGDPSHWPQPTIEFARSDQVKLATDPQGKQLYLVGGNQQLPLEYLERKGLSTDKRFVALGEVFAISYNTVKNFDDFRDLEYAHEFGEQTGERPFAYYDAELARIVLVGGGYFIANVDDALGASPGIVN